MKLSSGLLFLLVLLTFSIGQQEAREIRASLLGKCVELCYGDWDCEPHEKCISNGCDHYCSEGYF
ncbi:protein Wfdc21-like [Sarcophilus harrisii]|uniref:protein Wfdc21-like n=1 Tax=Sarcophilus harrisii TaxID=9305 RepID=UPI001301FFE5|nr:protein Wfdc21-like [Sarcophilus harrisii]